MAETLIPLYGGTLSEGTGDEDIICCIPLDRIWEYNYEIKKLFRFDRDVFFQVAGELERMEFGHGRTPLLVTYLDGSWY